MHKQVTLLALGAILLAASVCEAQTRRGNRAAQPKAQAAPAVKVDIPVAAKVWKLKMDDKETTKAYELRVTARAQKALGNDPVVYLEREGDTDFFPLQAYFKQLPLSEIPEQWRHFYFAKQSNLTMPKEHKEAMVAELKQKPLYEFTPKELDAYLPVAFAEFPDFRKRIMHYANKNIGQPYNMYLLGEFPFELYDSSPLYNLQNGDCVVFSEHMYAMTMSRNWKEFMQNLQKIRYKNGEIGYVTRNHFTEADWVISNRWMMDDLTMICDASRTVPYTERIDRAAFFGKYGIPSKVPVEVLEDNYIPYDALPSMIDKLQPGDYVNIARGKKEGEGVYIGHVGLVGQLPDGTKTFIHSTPPKSKQEPLLEYASRNGKISADKLAKGTEGVVFLGFKFHRIKAEELQKNINEKPIVY